MPNPLPSDQRRFRIRVCPDIYADVEGRHDSSQTAGRAADEDGLQPADTPAELTGPVWVVDDDDVRESLTFALQPRFEAASYPTLEAFLTQADLMQPGCLVIADRFAGLNESSLDEFNVQHELELRRSPVTVVFLSSLANIRAVRQGAVSFLEKPVDPEELGDAVAEGLERALRRAQRNRLAERFESLSKRERQIFVLICRGLKNGDIAALLELSQRTVEVHRAHISRKLGDAAPIRLLYELILAEDETLFNVSFDGIRPEGLAKVFAAAK